MSERESFNRQQLICRRNGRRGEKKGGEKRGEKQGIKAKDEAGKLKKKTAFNAH